ncbi:MAG: hypothetical protein ACRCX2_30150 [Paraclostridium sp.]
MSKSYEQVWKYITLPIGVGTVDPMRLRHGIIHNDGFIRETDSELYHPISYDSSAKVFEVTQNSQTPIIGVLFETHYDPTPMGKVAVAGVVPMKIGQFGSSSQGRIHAGNYVYYYHANSGTGGFSGVLEVGSDAALNGKVLLGIALEPGTTGDCIPILLKEMPPDKWPT